MIKKIILTASIAMTFFSLSAQIDLIKDSTSKVKIKLSGSLDGYVSKSFESASLNNLTSFTNATNTFGLGMASTKIAVSTGKMELVGDFGVGKRGQEFAYNDNNFLETVKQLYISYAVHSNVKLTAGTWATHLGYELVDPQLNKNYSMSYMFTNGPFTHTGIKADFTKGKSTFMVGLSRATDFRKTTSGLYNRPFTIAQYSYAFNESDKVYVNYVGGKNVDSSATNQFDIVATKKLADKWSLGFNATLNKNKVHQGISSKVWTGLGTYLAYDVVKWLGFQYRAEVFNDKNQVKMFSTKDEGGSIFANTFSANFKYKNIIIVPELRFDNASQKIFANDKKSATNFLIAGIVYF
jgi:hypothetical protein